MMHIFRWELQISIWDTHKSPHYAVYDAIRLSDVSQPAEQGGHAWMLVSYGLVCLGVSRVG